MGLRTAMWSVQIRPNLSLRLGLALEEGSPEVAMDGISVALRDQLQIGLHKRPLSPKLPLVGYSERGRCGFLLPVPSGESTENSTISFAN
jgi:hypothetical protein